MRLVEEVLGVVAAQEQQDSNLWSFLSRVRVRVRVSSSVAEKPLIKSEWMNERIPPK